MDDGVIIAGDSNSFDRFCENYLATINGKKELLNALITELGLNRPVMIIGAELTLGMQVLIDQYECNKDLIDFLYLDSQFLKKSTQSSILRILRLLSPRGILCVDSLSASEKAGELNQSLDNCEVVLSSPGFEIYSIKNNERSNVSIRYWVDLFFRKAYLKNWHIKRELNDFNLPEVAVVVLTYKHEDYISECLRSVLSQRGEFSLKVIVIDDNSPDKTASIVQSIISGVDSKSINIEFIVNEKNIGVVANLREAFRLSAGCDYLTFCEGDDFWLSHDRIQKHIEFLSRHPECEFSFNSIDLCDHDGGNRRPFLVTETSNNSEFTGKQLASNNFIGNFTACFYRGGLVEIISPRVFDLYSVDWFINLYFSQFGSIGYLSETLSIYRQHAGGEWSSRRMLDKALELNKLIGEYNKFLDFQFSRAFQEYAWRIYDTLDHAYNGKEGKIDLLIFDDVFPSLKSGFRYAEYTAYLQEFENSLVVATGKNLHLLERSSIDDVLCRYRRKNPSVGNKIIQAPSIGNEIIQANNFPLRLANLVYINFLTNTFELLPKLESAQVPFIFTLYPGGGFVLNDNLCDQKLKKIFESPCFQHVIVTQQITFDYLIKKSLCPVDKITKIFGVVMPEPKAQPFPSLKLRWGFEKQSLDICFMAHKYMPYGQDKGYDVFVNVARILCQRYDNINFHVIGPFDEDDIDIRPFQDRIKFYGSVAIDRMDEIFIGIDIILSPNISNRISPGSFDGFPTASAIEAGMRGIAMFAIDEFNSAEGHFIDGDNIVLIHYDLMDIVDKVERYYRAPEALKEVGQKGMKRINELYSRAAQIQPRIELIHNCLEKIPALSLASVPSDPKNSKDNAPLSAPLTLITPASYLRHNCPEIVKKIYRFCRGPNGIR